MSSPPTQRRTPARAPLALVPDARRNNGPLENTPRADVIEADLELARWIATFVTVAEDQRFRHPLAEHEFTTYVLTVARKVRELITMGVAS